MGMRASSRSLDHEPSRYSPEKASCTQHCVQFLWLYIWTDFEPGGSLSRKKNGWSHVATSSNGQFLSVSWKAWCMIFYWIDLSDPVNRRLPVERISFPDCRIGGGIGTLEMSVLQNECNGLRSVWPSEKTIVENVRKVMLSLMYLLRKLMRRLLGLELPAACVVIACILGRYPNSSWKPNLHYTSRSAWLERRWSGAHLEQCTSGDERTEDEPPASSWNAPSPRLVPFCALDKHTAGRITRTQKERGIAITSWVEGSARNSHANRWHCNWGCIRVITPEVHETTANLDITGRKINSPINWWSYDCHARR